MMTTMFCLGCGYDDDYNIDASSFVNMMCSNCKHTGTMHSQEGIDNMDDDFIDGIEDDLSMTAQSSFKISIH